MNVEVFPDAESVAKKAAEIIAADARQVSPIRGIYTIAVSGGRAPWLMLRELANQDVPWPAMRIFQVDERVAPAGDPDRNLTHLKETLLAHAPLKPDQFFPMPVEAADLEAAARQYSASLSQVAGAPPVLDLVHLGLGPDGHTASLIPGDPVLNVSSSDVALTGVYQGRRRMTLTYPIINRSRRILWLITGPDKVDALNRLRKGDKSIPAGRISARDAEVLADRDATGPAT